jgi:FkbM family methyltransferase
MFINNIKFFFKKIVPKKYHVDIVNYIDGFSVKSYSQEGEDMLLRRLYDNMNYKGFYVDIGAHHPMRFSNTFFFYKRGWNGINVDAMPGSMRLFDEKRSRDINLEYPIYSKNKMLTYFAFEEPALNTLSEDLANKIIFESKCKLLFKKEIKTVTLEEIFDKYLPIDKKIDFLSIDVEGLDFDVLLSNNWTKYVPKIILIEAYSSTVKDILKSEIYVYLYSLGYELIAKTPNTAMYKLKN